MGTERAKLAFKKIFIVCTGVLVLLSGVYLVGKKAIVATFAALSLLFFKEINPHELDRDIKASIQRHFSEYRVYIPHEDIHTINEDISKQLIKKCGEGNVYIWVPLEFELYTAGVRVFEWCIAMK